MNQNTEAFKLPDPLLVRYFRDGNIDHIRSVVEATDTRNITVTLDDGTLEQWLYLTDQGWIPQVE